LLRPLVNIANEADFKMLVAWLIGCFHPKGPYPILILNREQGSALSQSFWVFFLRWKCNTGFHWGEAKETGGTMVDFKGAHDPKDVIVHAVFFYVRYAVSYRDLEEILAERGVEVDHATLNRWVVKYSPLIAANAQAKKRPTGSSWRMDETYIKVKGK
jgi:hypothetical protein